MQGIGKVSIIVPVFNEVGNLLLLADEIREVSSLMSNGWELIFVDDGSYDGSTTKIQQICAEIPEASYFVFDENKGQSAALLAGIQKSTGAVIVTLDGDLQSDLTSIPAMLELYGMGFDMVMGWRQSRQDGYCRTLLSCSGNCIQSFFTGDKVHDSSCGLRVMRTSMAKKIPFFKGVHQFFPTFMRMQGAKVAETRVRYRVRHSGISKTGICGRLWSKLQNLLAVNWMIRREYAFDLQENFFPIGNNKTSSTVKSATVSTVKSAASSTAKAEVTTMPTVKSETATSKASSTPAQVEATTSTASKATPAKTTTPKATQAKATPKTSTPKTTPSKTTKPKEVSSQGTSKKPSAKK